jgi:hypothetical protein
LAATVFHFAWVDTSESVFGPQHLVEDENVLSITIEHSEGDFASLSIVIKNPRIGLLAPARKTWAWLSHGSTPLFFGRLVGVPSSINQNAVTLEFIARPANYGAQKETVAATLRTLPYYDRVFLTPEVQADPDTVLEARPELWHIDRTTLAVTTSHLLVGEDGLEEFLENEVPYDSVAISIGQVPMRALAVTADVSWKQSAQGSIDLGSYYFETYSGKSLIDNWPKPGDRIDGGYTVAAGYATDNYNIDGTDVANFSIQWTNEQRKHANGDTLSMSISSSIAPLRGPSIKIPLTSGSKSAEGEASVNSTWLRVPLWAVSAGLAVNYDAARDRKETISFTMRANFQPLVTLPGEEEIGTLHIGGGDVGVSLSDSTLPVGNVRNRSYFSTDRGLQSLEYLLNRARSQLIASGRAVTVSWDCSFDRAKQLSCRKNALLQDPRLPGGQALGKIVKYSLALDGESGKPRAHVEIACSIGYGGSVLPVTGEPTYVETGYVDDSYQFIDGQVVPLDAGDIAYTVPVDAPNDDRVHFPLNYGQAILRNTTHGSADGQPAAISALAASPVTGFSGPTGTQEQIDAIVNRSTEVPRQVEDLLKANSVWQEIKLRNLDTGPFETSYEIALTPLELPQGINLEAGSAS